MADSKITALTAISTVDPTADPLVIVDVSDTSMAASGTTKKSTINQLLGSGGTATLASATITGAATVGTTLGVTGATTLAAASVSGDLTVRTNKLVVTSTGVGVGMTPITPLSGVIGTTGAVFFRTTDPAAAVATPYIQAPVSTGFSSVSPAYGFWYQGCGIGNPALNNVSIITDSTERVKVGSTGDVNISTGNVVMATSGKGIDFAATANGSGTMTSELLNDYEEGTFVPVIIGTASAGTATYAAQIGRYTKVGRIVQFQIDVNYSAGTGTGNLQIDGLPFQNSNNLAPLSTYLISIGMTALYYAVALIGTNSTKIDINQLPTGGGSDLSIPYDGAGRIILSGTYTV